LILSPQLRLEFVIYRKFGFQLPVPDPNGELKFMIGNVYLHIWLKEEKRWEKRKNRDHIRLKSVLRLNMSDYQNSPQKDEAIDDNYDPFTNRFKSVILKG
jgi:hypothetical protein